MSIEDAIELIRSKYEDNKEKRWIRDPVAYTLYEVWKITDSKVVYHPSNRRTKPRLAFTTFSTRKEVLGSDDIAI